MHHSYPSISKSTVQSDMLEFQDKFYVKGQFELSKSLKHQLDTFLKFEELYKKNPEVSNKVTNTLLGAWPVAEGSGVALVSNDGSE